MPSDGPVLPMTPGSPNVRKVSARACSKSATGSLPSVVVGVGDGGEASRPCATPRSNAGSRACGSSSPARPSHRTASRRSVAWRPLQLCQASTHSHVHTAQVDRSSPRTPRRRRALLVPTGDLVPNGSKNRSDADATGRSPCAADNEGACRMSGRRLATARTWPVNRDSTEVRGSRAPPNDEALARAAR